MLSTLVHIVSERFSLLGAYFKCDRPVLACTGARNSATSGISCFCACLSGNGKQKVNKLRSILASIAPAITRGSVVFDAFLGLWSREKRLLHTVAVRKINENEHLGNLGRLRASGRDLPVMKMGLQNSRFCRAGHNREVSLVFQFSSGL
jgi:hypothetical protein